MKVVVCHRDTKEQKRESAVIGFGIRKGTERKPITTCNTRRIYVRSDGQTYGRTENYPMHRPFGSAAQKGSVDTLEHSKYHATKRSGWPSLKPEA